MYDPAFQSYSRALEEEALKCPPEILHTALQRTAFQQQPAQKRHHNLDDELTRADEWQWR